MNNSWWQELMRFFLQGMTLKQLIHMLIILILLIIIMPVTAKEWVNLHNPEILPPYWMYYALLFCISFVLNGFITYAKSLYTSGEIRRKEENDKRKLEDKIQRLTIDEKRILALFLDQKKSMVAFERNNHIVESLVEKGILINLGSIPYRANCDGYSIEDSHYHAVLRNTKEQQDDLSNINRRIR